MKTRIVYPKLWNDVKFAELNVASKLLFMYLVTNERLGLSRFTRLSNRQIQFDTGLTPAQIRSCKQELQTIGWAYFHEEWVYHNHNAAYIDYVGRDRVIASKEAEIASVPEEIKEVFKGLITGYKPVLNYKSKTINQKQEGDARGNTPDEAASDPAVEVLKRHNLNYGTNFTSTRAIQSNLKYWLEVYSLDDILKADDHIRHHEFWSDKMTPDVLLRRKNTKGEDVDYIGQLLNLKVTPTAPVRLGYKAKERQRATVG